MFSCAPLTLQGEVLCYLLVGFKIPAPYWSSLIPVLQEVLNKVNNGVFITI